MFFSSVLFFLSLFGLIYLKLEPLLGVQVGGDPTELAGPPPIAFLIGVVGPSTGGVSVLGAF